MIGLTVSHYRIVKKIGGGGMGVVYQAKDLKLGRFVALKFLPESLQKDSRAFNNLTREARAASALNHPNICTVYEIDDYNGQPFIAMELLEGETLRQRLSSGPMPVAQAIALTLEVLDALEAVHSNGIVHRDLKPENMFITRSGHVKLLDFGLAKVVRATVLSSDETVMNTVVDIESDNQLVFAGTLAYMSPEQVRDEDLGPQSDLFSLGAVIYEMLTGQRAFSGNTPLKLLEAVLVQTPAAIRSLNPAVPPKLQLISEKLLEKDRARRYRSATEVKADILAAQSEPAMTMRSWRMAAVAVIVALVSSVALYVYVSSGGQKSGRSQLPEMTITQLTSQPGLEFFPSLSPDGRTVAYASRARGNWDIFALRVGGNNPVDLTADSSADETQPAFSPSGDLIAFRSERDGGGIYLMGATGESARRLANFGFNPAWSPDGRQIVIAEEGVFDRPNERHDFSRLFIIDLASGQSRQLPIIEDGVQPNWSPKQHRIAYWEAKTGQRDVWTVRPDGTDAQRVTNDAAVDWNPVWDPSGKFLYFSSDRGGSMNLWRVPIDEESGKPLGIPQAITVGAGQRQHASISSDGRFIAYVEEVTTENIRRAPFDPKAAQLLGPTETVTRGTRSASYPNPKADGEWLAFHTAGKQEDIHVIRSDGTGDSYLTNDVYKDRYPRWSPDGSRIAFCSDRSGSFEIWMMNPDGSGLKQITNDHMPPNIRAVWSPDGRFLAGFHSGGGSFILDLEKIGSPDPRTFLPPFPDKSALFEVWAWSPDGKWLAGSRVTTPAGEYKGVVIYSIANKEYELLSESGYGPVWLADSRQLMFVKEHRADLLDIRTRKIREVGPVDNLGLLSSDNAFVYFTVVEQESDVWLIELHER